MLPPVESSVLVTNPKFEVLYRDLCANKLDKNGTSKLDVKSQKERDALRLVSVVFVSHTRTQYSSNNDPRTGAISDVSRGCEARSHPSQFEGRSVSRRCIAGRCTRLGSNMAIRRPPLRNANRW